MNDDNLMLYRWIVPVTRNGELGAMYRGMEDLVIHSFVPAVQEPVLQEHANAFYVIKQPGPSEGPPEPASVSLSVVTTPVGQDLIAAALERHFPAPPSPVRETIDDDPVLHPMAGDYRRGLTEVTRIALDLHRRPASELRTHQCFLVRLACSPIDPRFELHPYLAEHCPMYVMLSGMRSDKRPDLWSWNHEQFWARCYTPGPSRELAAPLQLLWNIVLGETPRRWSDPATVVSRLGIDC